MGSTTIQQPAPIQYSEQMRDTLMAQMEAQQGSGDFSEIGPMIDLESEYRPKWEALELQSLQNMLMGNPGGTRTVQDTRMVDTQSQVENPAWREAIDKGEIRWDGHEYLTTGRSRRTPTIEQFITKTTTTPEVYDREITTEATPGLLSMYQNQIAPAMSAMEAQYASDRAASEQALIEQYGAGITEKLREAAGNKELIGQIIADASGETDPALLNQMVDDASNWAEHGVMERDPNILASEVQGVGVNAPTVGDTQGITVDSVTGQTVDSPSLTGTQGISSTDITNQSITAPTIGQGRQIQIDPVTGQTVQAPDIGQGRQIQVDPVTGQTVTPGAEAGYVQYGQNRLQPAIDAGLLQAGQAELGAGDTEIDAALRARAMERMGSGLTEAESRGLQQGQRQAWAARGLGTTLPSAAAEAFYLAERGEDRQRQNEQMARGVSAELEARRQGRLGRGAGLIGQSYGQRLGAYQTDIGRSTGQQQMGLQAQMANQQTGLSSSLANQAAQLQAENAMLTDQQARDLAAANMGLSAQVANQQTNMQGQLANQAAQLQAENAMLSDQQARDLARANMGLQSGMANQSANMQSQMANQAAQLQAAGINLSDTQIRDLNRAQMELQAGTTSAANNQNAALANQAAILQAAGINLSDQQMRDLSRAQMSLQAGTTTAGNLMQSQLANQQAGLTAQEANRQYGYNVGAFNEANRFQQQQANRGYMGNVLGLQQQIQGGRFGRQMGAAQLGQQTSADPFLALLGRPSQAMGQAQGMGAQGYGMAGAMGPRIFQPESQLASDLAMSNYQGQLAANTASGQNKAAVMSGLFQGLGSAFACHVAREVYGEENPKWVEFYVWKETKGPRWFKALYNEYSEQWAQFIKDKPTLKAFIKNWMDTKLGGK